MENDITITQEKKYLFCESRWTFWALTLAAGMYGAYTYNLRGGVFCNAQTANIVLFGMALGKADWKEAAYFLIPISAYLFGTIFSEILAKYVKRFQFLRAALIPSSGRLPWAAFPLTSMESLPSAVCSKVTG